MGNPTCKVCHTQTYGPYQDIQITVQLEGHWDKNVYVIKDYTDHSDYLSGEHIDQEYFECQEGHREYGVKFRWEDW